MLVCLTCRLLRTYQSFHLGPLGCVIEPLLLACQDWSAKLCPENIPRSPGATYLNVETRLITVTDQTSTHLGLCSCSAQSVADTAPHSLPVLFQTKDLKSRIIHLEGSYRSSKEGLVVQMEARIAELEDRLESEER